MTANNQGIAHAIVNKSILCKNNAAHVAVSIEKFRNEPFQCKRCANKLAKIDDITSRKLETPANRRHENEL